MQTHSTIHFMHDLQKLDKDLIWHPFTPQGEQTPEPILIEKAEGIYLYTQDGRKIIDAISSWWVNLHGHSNPHIAKAIYDQASTLEHVIFAGFTHNPAIQAAKNLHSILHPTFTKIFFSDNGSTANEVAIKMAIQYWHNKGIQKKKIVALKGAYHGDTFGSMSVGDRSLFTSPFTDYLFHVEFFEFPTAEKEEETITQFAQLANSGDVGAFIFEPLIQGAAGMRIYSARILDALLQIAKEKNILCIADEVFTGFYRTGNFLATDALSIKPDIIALSKGITGGTMPMGVTACTAEIYDAFKSDELIKAFLHGHSYTANPLSCAAANASFDLLMSESCQQQIKMISQSHTIFLQAVQNHSMVKTADSLGTILSIEVKSAGLTSYENNLRKFIYEYFLNQDILLRPLGNIIYIVPPYVITEMELQRVYKAIESFLGLLKGR